MFSREGFVFHSADPAQASQLAPAHHFTGIQPCPSVRFLPSLGLLDISHSMLFQYALHCSAGREEDCRYFFSRTMLRSIVQRRD